jgi:glycosyltransferase involved in cell wall biosynthesis
VLGISVVIPTYRRPAKLRGCLDAVSRQTLVPIEAIVVVREEDEVTRALLDERSSGVAVTTVVVREPGVVAALNAGLSHARGDVVALTDDDTVPHEPWLERIVAHFESDIAIGAVGGRDVVHIGSRVLDDLATKVGRVLWFGRVIGNHHLRSRLQLVDFLKGANMACRRELLLGFDEELLGTGAQVAWDMDVSLSIRERGWTVLYDPEIVVDHYPGERFDEDHRSTPTIGALQNAVHNETYVLLKCLPPRKKAIIFLYGALVGSRKAPGLLLAFERLARESDRRGVLDRFAAAMQGRFIALGTFARLRRHQMRTLGYSRVRTDVP